MEASKLAAKFKKVTEWEAYLTDSEVSSKVKADIEGELVQYKEILAQLWRQPDSPDLLSAFLSSERRMQQLCEDARLFTAGR